VSLPNPPPRAEYPVVEDSNPVAVLLSLPDAVAAWAVSGTPIPPRLITSVSARNKEKILFFMFFPPSIFM